MADIGTYDTKGRVVRVLVSIFLFFLIPALALATRELARDINLAGKERMLIQRMSKDAFMVVANIEKERAKNDLKKSMQLFERTLKGLVNGDKELGLAPVKHRAFRTQITRVSKLWNQFKPHLNNILDNKFSQKDVSYVRNNNLQLLKEVNEAVKKLVAMNPPTRASLAQAINLSGKERMLTQSIAKNTLLLCLDPKDRIAKQELAKNLAMFEKILNGLMKGDTSLGLKPTELPWIKQRLQNAYKEWMVFKQLIQKGDCKGVADYADRLLVAMDDVTKLFEKSIQKQKRALALASLVDRFYKEKSKQKHVINLAGKQRMLTQKITKEALLVALHIQQQQNEAFLQNDIALFDRTLKGFVQGDKELGLPAAKNPEVLAQIKRVEALWKPFKRHAQNFLNKKDIKDLDYLLKNNEELLKESNILVQKFKTAYPNEDFIEKARKEIVDIAGRQRMLTQKMTKEKLLMLLHFKGIKNKLLKTVQLFDESLKDLRFGNRAKRIIKPANEKIKKQLSKVANIWDVLKPLYLKSNVSQKELSVIVEQNLVLLKEMDKAVRLAETAVEY